MDDLELFRKAVSALESGQNIALATVIFTTGSTPGKPGYKMLVFNEGRESIGTVGGGLIEAKMIEEAREMLNSPNSRVFRFDLAATPDDEKGICGGTEELLVETFNKRSLPLFKELSTLRSGSGFAAAAEDGSLVIDNDQTGMLLSVISPDKPPQKIFLRDAEQIDAAADTNFPWHGLPARENTAKMAVPLIAAIKEAAQKEQCVTKVSAGGMELFVESISKLPALVIFGAGHLSYYIAGYAKSVHFRVTVCDDRSEYANSRRFPDADDIIVEDFGRIPDKIRIDGDSFIVIVTRGHKYDELILEQAIKTNARYIGMIGSKRKTLMILERLKQKGFPEKLLSRIYSPIGISIGAVTPQEIALSIICELVKIRRLGHAPQIGHLAISGSRKLAGGNL
jgi:xanthine dehydrogenase accessory factor